MSHFIHLPGTETAAPNWRHRSGGTETAAPNRPASEIYCLALELNTNPTKYVKNIYKTENGQQDKEK